MKKPTLLILAAGMASRYGGMKQVDGFGPNGETIIDYSIYDAIRAGFGKITFVIRQEFEEAFRAIFEPKLNGKIETEYVFQDFDLKKYGIDREVYREKPWGTAHAVLAARDSIREPFCVINADDFYGSESFSKMADFLTSDVREDLCSMMGFRLGNTLSENGTVSRGVCEVDDRQQLLSVTERTKIYFKKDGNARKIVYEENDQEHELSGDRFVSMNFWGFHPRVFETCEILFRQFVEDHAEEPKAEFYIPTVADVMSRNGDAIFKVIPTEEKWFGVTYKEDKESVEASIRELVEKGIYPEKLF